MPVAKRPYGKGSVIFILFLLCLSISPASYGQDSTVNSIKRQKIGVMYGGGSQNVFPFNLPRYDHAIEYTYRVRMLQFQYYYSLTKRRSWGIEILVQPQVNYVVYRPVDTVPVEKKGAEAGVNAGILMRKNFLRDKMSVYWFISSGPHYVSGVPARQVPGFIFSDNLFAGINVKLHRDIYLDLRYGYRHISNAEIKKPNGGIDNMIANVGMYWRY